MMARRPECENVCQTFKAMARLDRPTNSRPFSPLPFNPGYVLDPSGDPSENYLSKLSGMWKAPTDIVNLPPRCVKTRRIAMKGP